MPTIKPAHTIKYKQVANHNKFILGLFAAVIIGTANAKGNGNSNPSGDIAKEVMQTYRDLAVQADKRAEDVSKFYTVYAKWFSGSVMIAFAILTVAGGIFGFKSLKEVKDDLRREIEREISHEKLGLEKLKEEHQILKNDLTETSDESKTFNEEIKKTIKISKLSYHLLSVTFDAYMKLVDYHNKTITDKGRLDSSIERIRLVVEDYESLPSEERNKLLEYATKETVAWTYNVYGTAQYIKGDTLEAYNTLSEATKLNPKNGEALYNLACAAASEKRYKEALQALRQAVSRNSAFAETAWKDNDLNSLRSGEPNYREEFVQICGAKPT